MSCDNFMFLLVRTFKDGRIDLISASDNEEEIGRAYLSCKAYEQVGEYRYDLYKLY